MLDSSGNVIYVNPAARRMLGLDAEQPVESTPGLNPTYTSDPTQLSDQTPAALALSTGLPQSGIVGATRADGREVWLQADSVPTMGPNGRVRQVATTLIEVTEQVRSVNLLKQRIERYSQLVETANQAIAITNHEGRFEYVNPRWSEMTGYSQEEARGVTTLALVQESEQADSLARLATRRHGGSASFDQLTRRKDGTHFWARISASPFVDAHGRIGALALVSDISELKDLMKALQESEQQARLAAEQLERLIETTADAITTSDLEGRCLSWNHGAERMFGWTKEEMLGVVAAAAAPERLAGAAERRQYVIDTGDDLVYESIGITKDGRRLPVIGTMSPLRNEHGQVDKLLVVFKDITVHNQLKQHEAQLALMEERERIGREVLDSVAQVLGYVNTKTEAVATLLRGGDVPRAVGHLDDLAVAARGSYGDLREAALNLHLPSPSVTVIRWQPERVR